MTYSITSDEGECRQRSPRRQLMWREVGTRFCPINVTPPPQRPPLGASADAGHGRGSLLPACTVKVGSETGTVMHLLTATVLLALLHAATAANSRLPRTSAASGARNASSGASGRNATAKASPGNPASLRAR